MDRSQRVVNNTQVLITGGIIFGGLKKNGKLELTNLQLQEFCKHRTILSDVLLVEKAKQLADELNVPEGILQFSSGWLQKFKDRNNIRQIKLQGEADSADENAVAKALPLLQNKCAEYPLE
ncbi:hypothetical protein RhiirA1_393026 [Rhizophagus irregularis]|uniref:HTH CENPB-type domain-containing protein n=1 Tax=Rhizophagus irregularis TaxID=588596 RepID=A0A2N0RYE8_9GLOM|nr:hypothetical protein RhiirA1_393026 [Rhizophagus irregularis]